MATIQGEGRGVIPGGKSLGAPLPSIYIPAKYTDSVE